MMLKHRRENADELAQQLVTGGEKDIIVPVGAGGRRITLRVPDPGKFMLRLQQKHGACEYLQCWPVQTVNVINMYLLARRYLGKNCVHHPCAQVNDTCGVDTLATDPTHDREGDRIGK